MISLNGGVQCFDSECSLVTTYVGYLKRLHRILLNTMSILSWGQLSGCGLGGNSDLIACCGQTLL